MPDRTTPPHFSPVALGHPCERLSPYPRRALWLPVVLPSPGPLRWRPVPLWVSRFPFSKEIAPMSDRDLLDAVDRKTGEDSNEIARRGFVLTDSSDARSAD